MEEVQPEKVDDSQMPPMWRCGDAFQYPVPKTNNDAWEVVLEALLKTDKARCDAWKDEVQNLLIFAGLFSAVVTAFVVEAAKSLQPDSNEVSVLLLARIASSLDSIANSTLEQPALSSFAANGGLATVDGPTASIIRVNIYWFMSLVLSLTTVLVGIVSLQWLREHQRYDSSTSPQQGVAIFNMRAEALRDWNVPAVFASLPLLLQAALLLFFVGLIDFLQSLSLVVVIPIACALLCPVLFILATTTIPTIQSFTAAVRIPCSDARVPSPCPYKSPQSHAFRRLATSSQSFFIFTHHHVVQVLYILRGIVPALKPSDQPRQNDAWRYRLLPRRAFLFWAHRNWQEFDRTWLILRNEYFDITRSRVEEDSSPQPVFGEPIYDAVQSIAHAAKRNEYSDPTVFSVYHCFQHLVQLTLSEDTYTHHHLQACYRNLIPAWNAPISNIVALIENPSLDLLHDIHTAQFLRLPGILQKAINPGHIFGKHLLELHTRILVYLYADEPRRINEHGSDNPTGFFHWYTINVAEASEDFLEQFFALFHSFVTTATTITNPSQLAHTFHAHSDVDEFISLASFLTWHAVITSNNTSDTPLDETKEIHRSLSILLITLNTIDKTLSGYIPSGQSTTLERSTSLSTSHPEFLFTCTALYLKRLWQTRPGPSRIAALPDISLFSQLLLRLKDLQHGVLIPFEANLDHSRVTPPYRRILPPDFSPSIFAKKGGGDFLRYGNTCGLSFTDDTSKPGVRRPMWHNSWKHQIVQPRRGSADLSDFNDATTQLVHAASTSNSEAIPLDADQSVTRPPRRKTTDSLIPTASPSPAYQPYYNPNAPDSV